MIIGTGARRSVYGVADQIVSSATNFLTAFVASYVLLPGDFGAFVVAYAVVTIATATVRALIGEPMLAHVPTLAPERRPAAVRSALGAAVLLGVAAGLFATVLGLSGVPGLAALVWFAPWVPVVIVQDAFRMVFLCDSRTGAALAVDGVWALVQVGALVAIFVLGDFSLGALAASWGVGALAGVAAAVGLASRDRRRPADPRTWIRQSRHLSGWFTLTSVLGQAEIYTVLILAGLLLAPVDAAGLRAVQLMVYQPAVTVMGALLVLVTPLVARAAAASDGEAVRSIRRLTLLGSCALAAVVLAVVPARGVLLETLFPQYTAFGALVLPLALQSAVLGLLGGQPRDGPRLPPGPPAVPRPGGARLPADHGGRRRHGARGRARPRLGARRREPRSPARPALARAAARPGAPDPTDRHAGADRPGAVTPVPTPTRDIPTPDIPTQERRAAPMANNSVLKTLRRSWWVLALFTLLGLGVAQVMVAGSPTLYSSTDTLYVSSVTKPGDTGTSAYEGNLLSQDRVKSYRELLSSGMIAEQVADLVGGGTTAGELQATTEVANQPETVLLTVTVTDPSPDRAAQIANAYGTVFGDAVRTLEKPQDPAAVAPVGVRTAFPATPYPVPISPRPDVALPVGLLLGLVAGIGLAVLRRRLDDRLDDGATLAALVGTRDLGSVRAIDPAADPVMRSGTGSGAAEDVRRLRGSLRHAVPADRPAVVLIAGAERREGRTTTAIELALALSDTGDRVLLLEADLRHPSIAARLGLDEERGLVSVLSWESTTAKVVQRHGPGFDVVVAGTTAAADRDWLSSSVLAAVLEELAAPYDWVVLDSPALATAADAGVLAPLSTGVVVAARHGRTSARALRRAVDGLARVGAPIVGTTLVGGPAPRQWRERLLRALSVPPPGETSMALPTGPSRGSLAPAPSPAQLEPAARPAATE